MCVLFICIRCDLCLYNRHTVCTVCVHAHQRIWARKHASSFFFNTATPIRTKERKRKRGTKLFSYFNRAITSIAVHLKCIQTHRHTHSEWIEKRDVNYIKNWMLISYGVCLCVAETIIKAWNRRVTISSGRLIFHSLNIWWKNGIACLKLRWPIGQITWTQKNVF